MASNGVGWFCDGAEKGRAEVADGVLSGAEAETASGARVTSPVVFFAFELGDLLGCELIDEVGGSWFCDGRELDISLTLRGAFFGFLPLARSSKASRHSTQLRNGFKIWRVRWRRFCLCCSATRSKPERILSVRW